MKYIWNEIENKSWHKLLSEQLPYNSPKSVDMRIQLPHSEFFMQPFPSFTLCTLPVYTNQETERDNVVTNIWQKDIYRICFAFEEEPFIADQFISTFKRIDGKTPIIVGEYIYNGLKYTFTYYSNPYEKYVQDTSSVEIKIENIGIYELNATIRMKPSITNVDAMGNHYIPYHWDTEHFPYDNDLSVKDDFLYLRDKCLVKIMDTDMDYFLEDKHISKEQKHYPDGWMQIYQFACYERAELRLKETINTIKFSKTLKKGECAYIKINCVNNIDCEDNEINKKALLMNTSPEKEIEIYNNLHKEKTELKFKDQNIEDIYYSQINTIHQMCVDFQSYEFLLPTQGGVGQRHMMWLWEAYCMMEPLISLGYHNIVKSTLEYALSMQDSPFKPDGRFTDLDGAIGTTGPRWVSTTGSALAFAAKYYNITKDEEFKDKYLNNLIDAGKWIVRQIRSTRVLDEKGEKVPWYGLMPYGRMNDDDFGYGISFSDSLSYKGLKDLCLLLKSINNPLYKEFENELKLYFNDIAVALEKNQREDGFILRLIQSEDMKLGNDFEAVAGPLNIIYYKACDPNTKVMKDYVNYFENHNIIDYFSGMINGNTVYTGTSELMLQAFYLETKQYKKAWECYNMATKYGMTQDTYQVQERYCLTNQFWCPWQPNGSGSGRLLTMIINGIFYETETEIILFGGFPYQWLVENGTTELNNLWTEAGKVSIKAVCENDKIKVSISGDYDKNKKIILQDSRFVLENS